VGEGWSLRVLPPSPGPNTWIFPGPRSLLVTIPRRLTLRGFTVSDQQNLRDRFASAMTAWIGEGRVTWKETVVEGIDHAVNAFLGLFTRVNIGKMLARS
jgi:NADPH-dependent curcumin reductase CurA